MGTFSRCTPCDIETSKLGDYIDNRVATSAPSTSVSPKSRTLATSEVQTLPAASQELPCGHGTAESKDSADHLRLQAKASLIRASNNGMLAMALGSSMAQSIEKALQKSSTPSQPRVRQVSVETLREEARATLTKASADGTLLASLGKAHRAGSGRGSGAGGVARTRRGQQLQRQRAVARVPVDKPEDDRDLEDLLRGLGETAQATPAKAKKKSKAVKASRLQSERAQNIQAVTDLDNKKQCSAVAMSGGEPREDLALAPVSTESLASGDSDADHREETEEVGQPTQFASPTNEVLQDSLTEEDPIDEEVLDEALAESCPADMHTDQFSCARIVSAPTAVLDDADAYVQDVPSQAASAAEEEMCFWPATPESSASVSPREGMKSVGGYVHGIINSCVDTGETTPPRSVIWVPVPCDRLAEVQRLLATPLVTRNVG
eukprot:TRINITY_DN21750_c0_g1_i1.p1 TRINITY_DN21750_c0_g1~~TRINITY_DN21750_c0_g1_i1.p1  ORF type:complete len:435 (+),score=83.36 TRINITY_DN21750_c0_g1_i1:75-1379(+)